MRLPAGMVRSSLHAENVDLQHGEFRGALRRARRMCREKRHLAWIHVHLRSGTCHRSLISPQTPLRPSIVKLILEARFVHVNWHGKRWFSHVSSSGMGKRRRESGLHQGRGRMRRGPSALFGKSAGAVSQHAWLVHLRRLSARLQRQWLLLHRHWRVSDQQRRLQHLALRAVHKHGGERTERKR